MMSHSLRLAGIATCASVLLLGTPSKSQAFFGWLSNCCRPQTAYMPVAPAPVAQTCQYMPVTSYRTVYKQVPVTTYQPVTSHSWCSCQPVTTYRPVTTYVTQAQQVPFTTYKPVYAAAAVPAVTYNAPAAEAVSYTQPAAPCCGSGAATSAPLSYGAPPAVSSPSYSTPGYSTPGYGPPTSQPTLSTPPAVAPQQPSPTPAPPTGGQPTSYGTPPPSSLPSYDTNSGSYNTASYNDQPWRAERAQTFASPSHTEDRVATSQPAASPAAAASGNQFRWRPAQD
jgi:hypothetical protein